MANDGEEIVNATWSLRRDLAVAQLKECLFNQLGYSQLGCMLSKHIAKLANVLYQLSCSCRESAIVCPYEERFGK